MNAFFKKTYKASMAIIAFMLLSSSFAFSWDNTQKEGIPWGDNLRQALEISRQTGKPVLLHFFSDTCPPCKMMESRTFPNPAIAKAVQESFIPVKLNVRQYPREAKAFNVQSVPMDLVLSPECHQIQIAVGGQDSHRYSQFLATAKDASAPYMKKYKTDSNQVGSAYISGRSSNQNPAFPNQPAAPSPLETESAQNTDSLPPLPAFPDPPSQISSSIGNTVVTAPVKIEAGGACPINETPSFDYASIPDEEKAKIEFEGYCPVELTLHSMWVRGDYNNRLWFEGRLYFFAGKAQMEEFNRNPERYVPAFNGNDPVAWEESKKVVRGSRAYGAWANGRVFLFSSEENLVKFEEKPWLYIPESQRRYEGVRRP